MSSRSVEWIFIQVSKDGSRCEACGEQFGMFRRTDCWNIVNQKTIWWVKQNNQHFHSYSCTWAHLSLGFNQFILFLLSKFYLKLSIFRNFCISSRRQICGSCDRYFCAACLGAFTVAPWTQLRHQNANLLRDHFVLVKMARKLSFFGDRLTFEILKGKWIQVFMSILQLLQPRRSICAKKKQFANFLRTFPENPTEKLTPGRDSKLGHQIIF